MTFVWILLFLYVLGLYCNEEEERKCGKAPAWFDLRMLDWTPEQRAEYWKHEIEKSEKATKENQP